MKTVLTNKDQKILHMVCAGFSDKEISSVMHMHIQTVKSHIKKLRDLFKTSNRTDLGSFAIASDAVDLTEYHRLRAQKSKVSISHYAFCFFVLCSALSEQEGDELRRSTRRVSGARTSRLNRNTSKELKTLVNDYGLTLEESHATDHKFKNVA